VGKQITSDVLKVVASVASAGEDDDTLDQQFV
jgi:hypothetical protein